MSFEIAAQQKPQSSGAMAIATSRQSADSQTQMIAAKHYPRDEDQSLARILKACGRKALAESAVYSYKKGDSVVEGASIRLAEVLAQSWGNMNCGFTVLESNELESQVMAFAWDLETNTQKALTFPVSHMRVTKKGSYLLTDPRDIYETVANAAARRVRACILALVPGDIQDAALEACTATMKQVTGKDLPDRIVDMVARFDEIGISEAMLESRLQTPLAAWTAQQVVAMGKLFVALRDGFIKQIEIPEFADPDIVPVSKTKPDSVASDDVVNQIQSDEPFGASAAREKLIRDKVTCDNNRDRAVKMLAKDPSARDAFVEVWSAFQDATSAEILEAAGQDYAGMIKTFSSDVQTWLRKWYQVRQAEMLGTSSDKE